jgi:uncharacterized protein (TIGR02391 family)
VSIVPRQPTGFSNRNEDQYTQVAGKYVHEKNSSCYLELGSNGSYVLFEGTQVLGTYEVSGAAITLFVARRPTSKATIEGDSIIDEQGDRWTRARVAPPAPAQAEKYDEPAAIGTDITQILPTPDYVLELEPEALGGYLLESLSTGNSQDLRLDNFTSRMRAHYKQDAVNNAFLEAWAWLVREGLLIATKGDTYLISRRGRKLKGRQDLEAFRKSNILPKESLHPVIADRVWPNFLRGEYETAVFQAFKEVEAAVRTAGRFQATDIGTDLIEKAFDRNSGPLTDMALPEAERQAMFALFAGAVGLFKNPSSHRHITLNDPKEAAEMIGLASLLMRTVDSRTEFTKTKKNP